MKKKKISSWCGKVCVEVNGPSCVAEFLQDPKKVIGIHLDLSGEHKSFIPASLAKKKKQKKNKKTISKLNWKTELPILSINAKQYYSDIARKVQNLKT